MNSSKRNAIILILVLLIGGLAYIWPKLSFNVRDLRFPDIVTSPDVNSKIVVGSPFVLSLNETNLAKADSIVVLLDKKHIKTLVNDFKIDIDTKNLPLGYHTLSVTVHKNKYKAVEVPFFVVSDITPLPMTHIKLNTIPRDPKSYTQGFEILNGVLFESGGQKGESLIRKVDPKNGDVIKNVDVDKSLFAEGLTILNDKIYQLTWQDGVCLIYDLDLNLLKKTSFRSSNSEGWGICNDGKSLIVSDGSNKLSYLNPETLALEKTISVYAGNQEVSYLNELEYVNGHIYANVYTTNQIAKIDATSGKVLSVADLTDITKENTDGEVLNGIAYNRTNNTFLVTGKNWKKMYEVRFN